MEETKVGYGALDALLNLTADYITAHIEDGKYTGDPSHLFNAVTMSNIITENGMDDAKLGEYFSALTKELNNRHIVAPK